MLTGCKLPSLACKCVFYRENIIKRCDPKEFSFEGLECENGIYQRMELKE